MQCAPVWTLKYTQNEAKIDFESNGEGRLISGVPNLFVFILLEDRRTHLLRQNLNIMLCCCCFQTKESAQKTKGIWLRERKC